MDKEITAEIKKNEELDDCPINSKVILIFDNGEEYHGIFNGFDGDDTIMLRSESQKPTTIGLPFNRLACWLLKL